MPSRSQRRAPTLAQPALRRPGCSRRSETAKTAPPCPPGCTRRASRVGRPHFFVGQCRIRVRAFVYISVNDICISQRRLRETNHDVLHRIHIGLQLQTASPPEPLCAESPEAVEVGRVDCSRQAPGSGALCGARTGVAGRLGDGAATVAVSPAQRDPVLESHARRRRWPTGRRANPTSLYEPQRYRAGRNMRTLDETTRGKTPCLISTRALWRSADLPWSSAPDHWCLLAWRLFRRLRQRKRNIRSILSRARNSSPILT